jgi:hypothetical protein
MLMHSFKNKMAVAFLLSLSVFARPAPSLAKGVIPELTFGLELAATNAQIASGFYSSNGGAYQAAINTLADKLMEIIPGATRPKFQIQNSGSVEIAVPGKSKPITISHDQGVIEVQWPPLKPNEVRQQADYFFRAAKEANLTTVKQDGERINGTSSHLHVGKNIFEKNPLLLRNLLVAMHNRPEFEAVFNDFGDRVNAQTVFERGEQIKFIAAIKRIDTIAKKNGGKYLYEDILRELRPVFGIGRERDVNLINLYGTRIPTVEFRFLCNQRSARDVADQALMMGLFLNHLDGIKSPIQPRRFTSLEWKSRRMPQVAEANMMKLFSELKLPKSFKQRIKERFINHRAGEVVGKDASGQIEVKAFDQFGPGEGPNDKFEGKHYQVVAPNRRGLRRLWVRAPMEAKGRWVVLQPIKEPKRPTRAAGFVRVSEASDGFGMGSNNWEIVENPKALRRKESKPAQASPQSPQLNWSSAFLSPTATKENRPKELVPSLTEGRGARSQERRPSLRARWDR